MPTMSSSHSGRRVASQPTAIAVGWLATRLPEWLELIVGIPAILGVYCWVIWWRGFGPEDRVLFRRNLAPGGPT